MNDSSECHSFSCAAVVVANGVDSFRPGTANIKMSPMARARMLLVVMSIGAGTMFLLSLDSVVDNLQPVAVPFLLAIYQSKERTDIAWEWIVSSRIYGLAVGCLVALLLANCQSRKYPFIGALLLNFTGGILSGLIIYMPFNSGVVLCCVGRFACGIGCGIAQVVGSAMLAEIPPVHSRGTVLATLTVWSCMGELGGMAISLDNLLGRPSTWHIALAAPSLIVPFILIVILLAPDSPRSLLMAGYHAEALSALKFYQCSADWPTSLADIKIEARNLALTKKRSYMNSSNAMITVVHNRKRQESLPTCDESDKQELLPFTNFDGSDEDDVDSGHHSSSGVEDGDDSDSSNDSALLIDRGGSADDELLKFTPSPKPTAIWQLMKCRLRSGTFIRPLAMGAFVLSFAHLDDWLWISYSTPVFENIGMSTSEAMRASLFMSLPQAFISFLLLFSFEEFSRRWLLIMPTVVSVGIAITGITALMSGQRAFFNNAISLKSLIAGLAALDLSAAAVASESAYTVVPELFSQTDRVLGSAIIGFLQNFFGGLLTTFALSVINMFGTQFVLLPFALLNIVYIAVIYRCLPETSGISFLKISQNFKEELPWAFLIIVATFRRVAQVVNTAATIVYMGMITLFTRLPLVRNISKPMPGGRLNAARRALIISGHIAAAVFCIHVMARIATTIISQAYFEISEKKILY